MDVAYIHNGYFNLIECKTNKWGNKNIKPTTEANEKLHKLASISQVAGLNSTMFFVSLYELSHESMKVARELNIDVISGKEILEFQEAMVL